MTNELPTTVDTAHAAPEAANVAPKTPTATRRASTKKTAPRAKRGAKRAKAAASRTATKTKKTASAPRPDSKKTAILELMRRKDGATLPEIMRFTGWQKHTIRGFVSILGKKGLAIESIKNAGGERCYRVTK